VLPFADASFDTVVALWISTDLDDFSSCLQEVVRVLRPGGTLVCYGVHPCFNGPHVVYQEDGSRLIHTTYRTPGWHEPAPWWGEDGIRRRVGMRHVPLADFLNAFLHTGLTIDSSRSRVASPSRTRWLSRQGGADAVLRATRPRTR
jgi:SAM-dependent methyltransferase